MLEVMVFGVEGPAWSVPRTIEQCPGVDTTEDLFVASVLSAARLAEAYPELLAASSRFLVVGTSPL